MIIMNKLFFLAPVIIIAVACNNGSKDEPAVKVPEPPKTMTFSIAGSLPHDTSSYTQGLLFYKGELYEGTGNWGQSKLKKVDLKTGKPIREISLPKEYFGEGITVLNDTVYQLTYKENKVFVYTLNDFRKVKEFDTNFGQGWGLTTDGKNLIVSTGGSDLLFYEPSTFKLLKTQTVTETGSPAFNINELEYINGYIYANQYEYPYIFKIDPSTGVIVAKADVTLLWERAKSIDPNAEVPNGIAYDEVTKKVYVTGKWWPEMYEVQFSQ